MTIPNQPLLELVGITKRFLVIDATGPESRAAITALDSVDLHVFPGEAVGIIGRNGAGKTTLLRLIAATSLPTSGTITRQVPLRAVLTLTGALQTQLTGRENIYLFGSLLGLLRRELVGYESEILAFAGLTHVADEPIRQYSQGMRMRLAFATATIGQPKLILLDEVIATGDRQFANQCRDRLKELRDQGTAIIVTSHDLTSIQKITSRLVWIDHGKIVANGSPKDVAEAYLATIQTHQQPSSTAEIV